MNQNGEGPVLIPAKRFSVWSRLYERFLLEPSPPVGSNAYVAPVIQPVTDADRLLRTPTIATVLVSVTAVGDTVFHTVPAGERWTLGFMRASRGSGTMTHSSFFVADIANVPMLVALYPSEAETHLQEFSQPLIVDEGWDIGVGFDAHSVTGDVRVTILYEREDAF